MKCVTVTAIQQQTLNYFLKIRTHFTIRLESELVAMFIPVTSFKQLEALKFQLCAVKDVCTIVRVLMWNTVVYRLHSSYPYRTSLSSCLH